MENIGIAKMICYKPRGLRRLERYFGELLGDFSTECEINIVTNVWNFARLLLLLLSLSLLLLFSWRKPRAISEPVQQNL